MAIKLTRQMKCAIGEQLVCARLIAHGWPTVNVNSTIDNFKGIDLLCQHGLEPNNYPENERFAGIQVKTSFQGVKSSISIGMNCKQAVDLEYLNKNITGPWVFVHVKDTESLDVDYYILTKKQMIDLVSGLHQWYLYGWERRPCKESLENAMAGISINHIQGHKDVSRFSDTCFDNPMIKDSTLNNWDNIWAED